MNKAAEILPSGYEKIAGRGARQLRHRFLAGIDEIGVGGRVAGVRPHTQHAVFRVERDVDSRGDVVGHEHRQPDAQIHIRCACAAAGADTL
jgi:hypothetical protein